MPVSLLHLTKLLKVWARLALNNGWIHHSPDKVETNAYKKVERLKKIAHAKRHKTVIATASFKNMYHADWVSKTSSEVLNGCMFCPSHIWPKEVTEVL